MSKDIELTEVDNTPEGSLCETQNLIDKTDDTEEGAEEYDNGDKCHICLRDLKGLNVAILECGHIYHFSCILDHFKNGNNYCIICNKSLDSQK